MTLDKAIKTSWPTWLIILSASGFYFGSALFSIIGAENSLFAPFWYANAFGLLCLLLVPKRAVSWALLFLGLANFAANIVGGYEIITSAVFVPGNLAEIWLASAIIARCNLLTSAFISASEFIKLVVFCFLIPAAFGAAVGSSLLFAYGIAPFFESYATWLVGDLMGYILIFPLCYASLYAESHVSAIPSKISTRYKSWGCYALFLVIALGIAYYFLSQTNTPFLAIATVSAFAALLLDFRRAALLYLLMSLLFGLLINRSDFQLYNLDPTHGFVGYRLALLFALFIPLYFAVILEGLKQLTQTLSHNQSVLEQAKRELEVSRIQAEQANQAKSSFLAKMSHEIRTPLNAIIGMSYTLGLSQLTADQREQLATIESASRSLLAQINDILDLSKIEAGEMILETVRFSLPQLIAELANLFGPDARKKGLVFTLPTAWDDFPAQLEGDGQKLQQMLVNLISNALKFTAQGYIAVGLSVVDRFEDRITLRFCVTDTGIGIAPEALPKLFQPFIQADASTTRKYGGSGLGLSLVRQLCEHMGGQVTVESTPGQGSSFCLELPFRVAAPATTASHSGLQRPIHSLTTDPVGIVKPLNVNGEVIQPVRTHLDGLLGVRVLVVDDSEMNLKVCQRLLGHQGAIPTLCLSGQEAIRQVADNRDGFDVVLMDVQMPGMDGCETTRQLRQLLADHPLPIIALTAGVTVTEREQAIEAGMDAFLTKPIVPTLLLDTLKELVECAGQRPLPVLPRESAVSATATNTPWPVIDGLDIEAVRTRLADDLALFTTLANDFLEESHALLQQAQQGLSDNQSPAAAALHRLRGQCGNIGAMALAATLAQLETAARSQQLTTAQLADSQRQLAQLTDAIRAWQQGSSGTMP